MFQELRAGFEEEAASSGQPRLELSAAVAAGRYLANSAYEMDKIGEWVTRYTKNTESSAWQSWYSLETLKLAFDVSCEGQGNHRDDLCISVG